MIQFDADQVVTDVRAAVSAVLGKDVATYRGYVDRQVKALAKQAKFIASGYATGDLDDDEVDYFLDGLERMAETFARTIRGLVLITIEKVWNAVVEVLHGAIRVALAPLGVAIPGV